MRPRGSFVLVGLGLVLALALTGAGTDTPWATGSGSGKDAFVAAPSLKAARTSPRPTRPFSALPGAVAAWSRVCHAGRCLEPSWPAEDSRLERPPFLPLRI